jgi:large subunit ribosomal protein L11
MKVPVKIIIDSKKNFEIIVGSPPASALIKKELNLQKGSKAPNTEIVGNLSMQQLIKIAKMKLNNSSASSLKKVANEIAGTCNSMGVTIEGKPAHKIIKQINQGKFDSLFENQK